MLKNNNNLKAGVDISPNNVTTGSVFPVVGPEVTNPENARITEEVTNPEVLRTTGEVEHMSLLPMQGEAKASSSAEGLTPGVKVVPVTDFKKQTAKFNTVRIPAPGIIKAAAKQTKAELPPKQVVSDNYQKVTANPETNNAVTINANDRQAVNISHPETSQQVKVQAILTHLQAKQAPKAKSAGFFQKIFKNESEVELVYQNSHVTRIQNQQPNLNSKLEADKYQQVSLAGRIFNYIKTACFILVILACINYFVVQRNQVSGISMQPTLADQDQIIVSRLPKLLGLIHRGDVVVISSDNLAGRVQVGDLIRRVVAVGGDVVEIKDGHVFVNGEELAEPYLAAGTLTEAVDLRYQRVVLGEDQLYLLGDNRSESLDSRFLGPISKDDVIAKCWIKLG